MQAVGHFVAMAFEEYSEFTAAAFYGGIVVTFRYADNRFHLFLIVAFGDVVYQLFDDIQAFHDFIHADEIACPGITFGVTQIADAVTELNGGTSKFNLVVNPIVSIGGINKGTLHIGRQECVLTNIEFNLSLTTSENKGSDAKVGVFASVIGVGASSNENAQNEIVSKIKFSLPILLPTKEV